MSIPYVKVVNNQATAYPYTFGQLRKDNPNVSFPKSIPLGRLAEWGLFPTVEVDAPTFDEQTEFREKDALPTLVNGVWERRWTVRAATVEEQAEATERKAAEVRAERDRRLVEEVDKLSNNPMRWADWLPTQHTKISEHRQALLDVPQQAGFPYEVVWPVLVV